METNDKTVGDPVIYREPKTIIGLQRIFLVITVIFSGLTIECFGVMKTFTGPGNFSDAAKWDGGALPAAGDDLTIEAACTIDNNAGTDNVLYGSLIIGGTSVGMIDWIISGTNRLNVLNVSSAVAGSTLDMTNGGTLIIRGTLSNTNLSFTPGAGTVERQLNGVTISSFGTYNNLIINTSGTISTGRTFTINGDLTISNGTFSIGAFSLTVAGTTAINGTLTVASITGTRSFGNLIINGTYDNSANDNINSISGDFQNNGNFNIGTGRVTFTGASSNTISGTTAVTAFGGGITVNKGSDNSNILDVQCVISMLNGGLILSNGTFKLSSASTIVPFTSDITAFPYLIPATAGLWCNGGTMNSPVGGISWSPQGLVRISSGTINAGNVTGNYFAPRAGANIIVEGGNFNLADRMSQVGSSWSFTMTGGTMTVAKIGSNTLDRPVFNMEQAGCSFSMSGGTMIIANSGGTAGQNLGYYNIASLGAGFTGGTLQIGDASTPAGSIMQITTSIPIYNLTVNSANATAQIQTNSITVTNDLTITAGTLNANALNITIGANWSNSGTFTASTGTVTFNGSSSQTIINNGTGDFYNLTINKPANDVTLNNNITVANILTLTARKIILGNNNLTIGSSGSIAGGSSTSYVVSNSTGTLIQNNIGSGGRTGAVSFPVGYSTSAYTPVRINNSTGTADAFNVRACQYQHTDGTCSGAEKTAHVVRATWYINEAVAGGSNASVSVTWNAADEGTSFDNTNCGITTYTAGAWTTPSAYSNASATRTLSKTLTTMYPISIKDNRFGRMTYVSSTVLQNNTDSVLQGSIRQEIICIRIYTEGNLTPLDMDRFNFNTDGGNGTGSEDPIFDLKRAEIFYTGLSSVFSTSNYYNRRIMPINAFSIIKPGAYLLSEGYNYFWLTYNISGDANTTHNVDAQLTSFRLSGVNYSDMTVSAPVGKRPIKGASIYYAIGSGNINNTSIWSWNIAGGSDNGPSCGCAPNGDGLVYIDTNYTITMNASRVFDGLIVQQGAALNYVGANITLRINNNMSIQGTGRFQLDSVNILGDLNVGGTGINNSNSFINADGDIDVAAGATLSAGDNVTVGGNLTNNGTIVLGANTLTMDGGDNYRIEGRGNITGSNKVIVTGGNKLISDSTDITVQPGFEIQGAYTVTNNDSITIQGNLTGTDASSAWVNDSNAVLMIGGTLLTTGQLTATAPGNTIHYTGAAQNIKSTVYHHLAFSGSGIKTLAGDITVNGNLSITGVSLDASSGNNYGISLLGNWNNTGTFTPRNGTVTFNGNSAQSIANAAGETFYNLTLNKISGDLTLTNSSTVNNILALSAGRIILGSSNLSIGNSGSISGGSNSSFIVTDGTGLLCQQNIGSGGRTGSVFFPVGDSNAATAYSPVILDNSAGTADRFDVKVCNYISLGGTCSGSTQVTSIAVNRTWTINEAAAGGSNAAVTLQWNESDELSGFDRTMCYVSHHNGTNWGSLQDAGSASGTDPYTRSVSGVSNFSPFAVGGAGSPLPVELIIFEAKLNDGVVDLHWQTATEVNNDYFTIERSADLISFETIAIVNGSGNSSQANNYSVVDARPLAGISYYRLKQTDFDGKYTYSELVSIDFRNDNVDLNLYPNPLNSGSNFFLTFNTTAEEQRVAIFIADNMGKEVFSKTVSIGKGDDKTLPVDCSALQPGIYVVKVASVDLAYTQKLVIK